MIPIFDIKKAKKNSLLVEDQNILNRYLEASQWNVDQTFQTYQSRPSGLYDAEVQKRQLAQGPNQIVLEEKRSFLFFFLHSFQDGFTLLLLALALINFFLKDPFGSLIIVLIAVVSALIRSVQEHSVYRFNQQLKEQIQSTTTVLRNQVEQVVKVEDLVVGDLLKLNAGTMIPADIKLLESKDLFLNQAVFTGESIPVEKKAVPSEEKELFSLTNICLMGASVISGSATAIVIQTGFPTYLGTIGRQVQWKKEPTAFDLGMKKITNLLIRYMLLVCLVVFVVHGFLQNNWNEAILFALSVAVGITPSMLPMIVNVNLAKGSKTLAKKQILVKKSESIQNLGAIDLLCTDKTGTLTEDQITLQRYWNVEGKDDPLLLKLAYINSFFSTGMKNLIDRAVLAYGEKRQVDQEIQGYQKVDEIPFDYDRKKTSIVIVREGKYQMITKGAFEEVLKCCTKIKSQQQVEPITSEWVQQLNQIALTLAKQGMQVIALAEKEEYRGIDVFNEQDEQDLIFVGFIAFLDPPKKGVKETLAQLKSIGIQTKILTGDHPDATRTICALAGLNDQEILLGTDLDQLSEEQLREKIETVDVFARLNPIQKERVVDAYKKNGHVVGYMGDGVNDAPSLHQADIGISVNRATDIAKEASDLILLEKELSVIYDGVLEGRTVYGNIMKYMKMALSGDFGDVFSILLASIFLPFLPLLPIQMLLQDFIYDLSQIGIPYDHVDSEFLLAPKKWDTKGLSRFMNVMGLTSSLVDLLAFVLFWFVLGYQGSAMQSSFQTAWFVTCLITELMIIYQVRTSKKLFFQSKPSKTLLCLTGLSMVITILTPMILSGFPSFHFVILPLSFYGMLGLLVVCYFVLVSVIKKWYQNKYHEWL